jgi:hypothetical protein
MACDNYAQKPTTIRQPIPFIGELYADESKRGKTPVGREVNMMATQTRITLAYLKWLKAMITFDRTNHANHIQSPRWFALVVSAIVG